MKTFKYFSMMLAMLVCCMGFVSCSDDDDDNNFSGSAIDDFYIMCTASGGGLDSRELASFEASLNNEFVDLDLTGLKYDEAIYMFDSFIKNLKRGFSEGLSGVSGTLKLTFYLKTTSGKEVKRATLNITKDGCE